MPISEKLVLFKYLLRQFGFEQFSDLQRKFADEELKADSADRSVFYAVLKDKIRFSPADLARFDDNINEHLSHINRHRARKINLKYYQYLSLLFTEYYLDRYFADKDALAANLELYRRGFEANSDIGKLTPVDRDELNLIAYWQATGSGKTFTLHFNILQYRHYAKLYKTPLNNLIVLTPGESLSRQHLLELEESGIEADYYLNNKAGNHVKVIDIHKIKGIAKGQGVTISVAEFGQQNGLFVDEGHKGNDKEEGVWRKLREEMGYNGFTFEYSATFGQVGGDLQNYYAKRIAFDYSFRYFNQDGYGKDYRIHNISEGQESSAEVKQRYLLCNLLLFAQQKLYFKFNEAALERYQIADPLLIFVGHTVNPKAKGKEAEDNEETIADVQLLLKFWQDFLTDRAKYETIIGQVLAHGPEQFCQEYNVKLHWLFAKFTTPRQIYDAVLENVLNAVAPDKLELCTLRDAPGEIGLRVKGSEIYFGLINIGDVSKFKTGMEHEFTFLRDSVTAVSLFDSLSDKTKQPVNVLIGARKFIEGWNNYRVSGIGLINFGKSEGAQIIQLFGRGVRLYGQENSLKRSTEHDRLDEFMPIVETLNIFGLNADYMKRFEEDLKNEGILQTTYEIQVPIRHWQQNGSTINDLRLIVPQKKKGVPPFNQTAIVELGYNGPTDAGIKVLLDLSTKSFVLDAANGLAGTQQQFVIEKDLRFAEKYLDFDKLYFALIRFKQAKRYHNLHIRKDALRPLLANINLELKLDEQPAVRALTDIERWQRIASQLLQKYAKSYYERHLRVYEGKHLESSLLEVESPALSDLNYTIEVLETNENGIPFQDFNTIKTQIETFLVEAEKDISQFRGSNILLNAWFDNHLYQPLLNDAADQPIGCRIKSIKPKGLNDGERRFVGHLRAFIEKAYSQDQYTACEFYLLRNSSVQSKGFGFYFSASGGFYPDFLLWIKQKSAGAEKQYLTFIDPHGLRNEDTGFSSDKIQLHMYLKTDFPEIANVTLNSFILATSSFDLSAVQNWERPDKNTDIKTYCNSLNIYELGNGNDFAYISAIIRKILA